MLSTMSLRDFFRWHGNVFSISTPEVDGGGGNEDMLVEEYGERAVEAERPASWAGRSGRHIPLNAPAGILPDRSSDEIADAEPPPDPAP